MKDATFLFIKKTYSFLKNIQEATERIDLGERKNIIYFIIIIDKSYKIKARELKLNSCICLNNPNRMFVKVRINYDYK